MCGISITRRANAIDQIQHRGIESTQIAEGGWFLGHVRLPIQTEQGDGLAQPIELAGDNGWLLYVGEIYNYPTRYSSDVEYLRSPFLSHDVVRFALRLPREYRTHKRILKDAFRDDLPQEIIDRPKECQSIRQDPTAYRKKCHETFYRLWQ